jgi:hypothetical protein
VEDQPLGGEVWRGRVETGDTLRGVDRKLTTSLEQGHRRGGALLVMNQGSA